MKLKAVTIFELIVLIIVFSILSLIAFNTVDIFKNGLINTMNQSSEHVDLNSLHWKIARTHQVCDSAIIIDESLCWFNNGDTTLLECNDSYTVFSIHGVSDTIQSKSIMRSTNILDQTHFIKTIELEMGEDQTEIWLFEKTYPSEITANKNKTDL